jgi:hypothetical protein
VPQAQAEALEPRPVVLRAGQPWAEAALPPSWKAEEVPQQLQEERSWRREVARPPKPLVSWKRPFAPA